jgi:hypothetical protein
VQSLSFLAACPKGRVGTVDRVELGPAGRRKKVLILVFFIAIFLFVVFFVDLRVHLCHQAERNWKQLPPRPPRTGR